MKVRRGGVKVCLCGAVASFPQAVHPEEAPALGLFDNVEELDRELTDFLTGYVHVMEQWQAQASQAP